MDKSVLDFECLAMDCSCRASLHNWGAATDWSFLDNINNSCNVFNSYLHSVCKILEEAEIEQVMLQCTWRLAKLHQRKSIVNINERCLL